mgnify:CR=1 FL=1
MAVGSYPHEIATPLFFLKPRLGRCYHCKEMFDETDTFVEMSTDMRTRLYHSGTCFNVVAERLYRRIVRRKPCYSAMMFETYDATHASSYLYETSYYALNLGTGIGGTDSV